MSDERIKFAPSDVFISWNNNDLALKNGISSLIRNTAYSFDLCNEGNENKCISVYDSDFECTGNINDDCLGNIRLCKLFVVLITKHSIASQWVLKEIQTAKKLDNALNRIVPIFTDKALLFDERFDADIRNNNSAIFLNSNELSEDKSIEIVKKIKVLLGNFSFEQYRKAIVTDSFRIPVYTDAFDEEKCNTNCSFSDFYINRTFEHIGESSEIQKFNENDLINSQANCLIYGEGGLGKSFFVKQLISSVYSRGREYSDSMPLLFPVECRKIKCDSQASLKELLWTDFCKAAHSIYFDVRDLTALLENKKHNIVILLDGLDEASERQVNCLLDLCRDFIAVYNKTRFIVTTRNAKDRNVLSNIGSFELFKLLKLSADEVTALSQKLFLQFNDTDKLPGFFTDISKIDEDIKSNPLLLSQLAIIYEKEGSTPETLAAIYAEITNIISYKLDTDKQNDNFKLEGLELINSIPALLPEIAFILFKGMNNGNNLNIQDAIETIIRKWYPDKPGDYYLRNAISLINYLRKRAIVYENEFAHKMFLEYYTAQCIFSSCYSATGEISNPDKLRSIVESSWDKKEWEPIIKMLVSISDFKYCPEGFSESVEILNVCANGKLDLLFEISRLAMYHKKQYLDLILGDIIKKTLNETYLPYAQWFAYPVIYSYYTEMVSVADSLYSTLCQETKQKMVVLSLLRDFCYFNFYNNISELENIDQEIIERFENRAKEIGYKSHRSKLNYLFFCKDGTERIKVRHSDNIYPQVFSLSTTLGKFEKTTKYRNYKDELGLWNKVSKTEPIGAFEIVIGSGHYLDTVNKSFEGVTILNVKYTNTFKYYSILTIKVTIAQICFNQKKLNRLFEEDALYSGGALKKLPFLPNLHLLNISKGHGLGKHVLSGNVTNTDRLTVSVNTSHFGANEKIEYLPITLKKLRIMGYCNYLSKIGKCENLEDIRLCFYIKETCSTFEGCVSLKTYYLPDTVRYLGISTFSNCQSLKTICLSNNIKKINQSLEHCISLEELKLPENVKELDLYKFITDCPNIRKITFPRISDEKFLLYVYDISNLEEVIIPDKRAIVGHEEIEKEQIQQFFKYPNCDFEFHIALAENFKMPYSNPISDFFEDLLFINYCRHEFRLSSDVDKTALTDIEIPQKYRDLDTGTFYECENLKHVKLSSKINDIPELCFENCRNLTEVELGGSKLIFGVFKRAFFNCSSIEQLDFSKKRYVSFDDSCFANCTSLKRVIMPKDLLGLGSAAFCNCSSLEAFSIKDLNAIYEKTFYGCSSMTEFDFGTRLEIIDKEAFAGCSSLRKLSFPKTLRVIDDTAFDGCNIQQIEYYSHQAALIESVFGKAKRTETNADKYISYYS